MQPKRDMTAHHAGPRGNRLRAALLLALALAFLSQTFSWAARLPARPAAQAVEICVAHGTAVVMLDADGNPVEQPRGGPAHDCPLCPLIAGLSVAPIWDGVPPPAALPGVAAPIVPERPFIRVVTSSDVWARGPPRPDVA